MKNNPITTTMDIVSGAKRMTYDTMSKKLGVARQTVINYEKNPDIIPCSILKKLSILSGATIDELTADDTNNIVPPHIADIYDKLCSPVEDIIKSIEVIQEFIFDSDRTFEYDKEIDKTIMDIKEKLEKKLESEKKLNIAVCGMAGAGKSSLINHILGEKVIPISCYYGTPAFTYYHHISEKPDYIYGKNDTVIICEPIQDSDIADNGEKVIIGYHSVLLKAYVKDNNGCTIEDGYTIKRIDVYLDNENLKGCTILDTPRLEPQEVSTFVELNQVILKQDYILLATSSQRMLEFPYEINLIQTFIEYESNQYYIRPNIVVTNLDLYNDSEVSGESAIEACKKNLLNAVSKNEKIYIEENYKNRFLAVDIYNKKWIKIFNESFSATFNSLMKEKFRILVKNIADACFLISKDFSARKNILSSELSFYVLDESKFQSMAEDLLQKKGKSMCDVHQNNALKNYSIRFDEITNVQNVLGVIKLKKITCDTDLNRLTIHLNNVLKRAYKKEIDSEFDVFIKWACSEMDKLFELIYHIDNMENDFFAIFDGFIARDNLNLSAENPYNEEEIKELDNKLNDLINDSNYSNKIKEIFDMDKVPSKERDERLAEIVSSRYKCIVKEGFIIDLKTEWKNKTDYYFEKILGRVIKILQEYTFPEKRGTPEEATQRAADYEEAAKVIEKIGQRCMAKIENIK